MGMDMYAAICAPGGRGLRLVACLPAQHHQPLLVCRALPHTLRALHQCSPLPPPASLALRTGVIKIGSGSDFLDGVLQLPPAKGDAEATPLEFLGTPFHAMGKKA